MMIVNAEERTKLRERVRKIRAASRDLTKRSLDLIAGADSRQIRSELKLENLKKRWNSRVKDA